MQKTVIEDQDFGVEVRNLRDKIDLFEVPVETVEAREVADKPIEVSVAEVKKMSDGALLKAAKDNVESKGTLVLFDGETYTVPKMDDWDLDWLEAMETNPIWAVRQVVGEDQWKKFKPEGKKRTMTDLGNFFEAIGKAQGTNRGE